MRSLRFEGDFIYAETVLTEEQRNLGFDSYELKKNNDGSYKGVHRAGGTCSYIDKFHGSQRNNRCTFENQIEFTNITPIRIEGRIFDRPQGAKFDCKKCSYFQEPVWQPFVWIPQ